LLFPGAKGVEVFSQLIALGFGKFDVFDRIGIVWLSRFDRFANFFPRESLAILAADFLTGNHFTFAHFVANLCIVFLEAGFFLVTFSDALAFSFSVSGLPLLILAFAFPFSLTFSFALGLALVPFAFTLGNHDASGSRSGGRYSFALDRQEAERFWRGRRDRLGLRLVDASRFPFAYSVLQDDLFLLVWDASAAQLPADQLAWAERSLASPAARGARERLVNPPRKVAPEGGRHPHSVVHLGREVDPGGHAHTLKQVHHILRGQVARSTRSVGATSDPSHRRIEVRQIMTLSLTFDHRVIDGAPASRFLQTLVNAIANPAARLIFLGS
jgi:hypothetical protein